MTEISRRDLLRYSGLAAAALNLEGVAFPGGTGARVQIAVNLNENAFGPSPTVASSITRELNRLARYASNQQANALIEQIAAHERVHPDQVLLGEVLGGLGLYLGTAGGPGGEFLYSVPGYLALVDAAAHAGGVGVPVPLNADFENDLPVFEARLNAKTRALYLIHPHNPTGTINDASAFHAFLQRASAVAPVIVDEAYLEYTADFAARSAVSLVRDGANVLVFRTFDKIYGLAGMPIGYTLAPAKIASALRKGGLGDAEGLGRLNLAAASAALADQQNVEKVRVAVATEREKWERVLDELKLHHTRSQTNFIFFDSGGPQQTIAEWLRDHGIIIARAFPPYSNWARITIGLPQENRRVQDALRDFVRNRS